MFNTDIDMVNVNGFDDDQNFINFDLALDETPFQTISPVHFEMKSLLGKSLIITKFNFLYRSQHILGVV